MSKFLTLFVSGAVTGAIYSLIAAGLTLSYSATGIFNFSYGAIAFMCAFLYYELNAGLHWPIVPAAAVTILVFAPLLGLLLNAAVFRPLARASESAKIMATVGLLIALPALTRFLADTLVNVFHFDIPNAADVLQVGFPSGIGPVPRENWKLPGDVPLDSNQLIVFIAAVVAAVSLWVLLRHTALGLQMRAVVDRPDLARTRGVDDRVTSRYAWVIGMVLAGTAGVVGAPILGSVNPNSYIAAVFVASAAAVLGGLRSVPLAFLGGLLLGVAQNLVFGYATFAEDIRGFNASVPFVLLLVGLVVMTRDRSRRGGSATEDAPPPDYVADLPPWRRALPWAIALVAFSGYLMFLADEFWLGVMANGLALSLIFLSFVIVTGLGGMVSLAQATLVTAASLTAGMLLNRYDFPFVPALIVGALVAMVIGAVVALPALRLGGLPLALATLALAFLGDNVLFAWEWIRNGTAGWSVERPSFGPIDLVDNRTMAFFLLALIGVVTLLIRNLQRSSSGRSIAAVRSSEPAASTSGVSPVHTKLAVFALSAAVAGVGGVMLATFRGNVSSVSTPATVGLLWLATVVLFGIRRPAAAVIAGIVSAASPVIFQTGFHFPDFVPSFLSWNGTTSTDIPTILFGLGAVQLARNPDGVLAITAAGNQVRRIKRAARARMDAVRAAEDAAASEETARHERELEESGILLSSGASPTAAVAASDEGAALALRGISAGYGEVQVLHGVGLAVRSGEITALLGANGSGKTTLCRTVSGLVTPTEGTIVFSGKDVTGESSAKRSRRGVLVAPESRGIFPGLSVEENLTLLLRKESDRQFAYDRFPVLRERRRLPAGNLSGGEQQMLTLAPLLVQPPDVLVVDEPTLGLAPLVVNELMTVFTELRDRGVALLLVEEKTKGVLEIADQVAVFELGRIAWQGPRADVNEEQLAAAYLGASTV